MRIEKTRDLKVGDVLISEYYREVITAIEKVETPVAVVRIDVIRNGTSPTFFWSGLEAIHEVES